MRPIWKPLADSWPGGGAIPNRSGPRSRDPEEPSGKSLGSRHRKWQCAQRRARRSSPTRRFPVPSSGSRRAPIDASVIREIPFRNASEAVTIVLSQVKAATKWPAVLGEERFAAERKAFEEIVDKAVQEDEEGDISADTLKSAHELVRGLRDKLAAMPLEGTAANQEATRFLKTLAGLVRMLERPDTNEAFNQLRMVKSTSSAT